jgi:hypothetical protein
MSKFLIILLLLIITISFALVKIQKRKKKKSTSNKKSSSKDDKNKKIKLDTDVEGFDEVKRFNRDEYLKETFNQVFYAIEVDDWTSSYGYRSIQFVKDNITLKVDYSDHNNFKIKSITLTSGYNTFNYTSTLNESTYRFIYNIYSEYIKKENETLKKSTDDSLSEIHKVIGKSSIRDNKINQLLDDL